MSKSKRIKKLVFSLGFILLSFYNAHAQDSPVEELAFQDQEAIVYKIYYNWKFIWIPAGEVKFLVNEKDDHFEFNVTGYSYESYDSFFKVRDYYTSRTEKENLLPINFRRNILEGNYTCYDSLNFDQEAFKVFEKFGKTEEKARDHHFQLDNVVLDMVSAIYYLRSMPMKDIEKNTNIPFRIFFDKEHFELDIKYKGKTTKKVKDLGKVKALHYQPELVSGYVFQEGDIMDIWISDDQNKIPLQIESPISFGSVKAVLKSAEGLKHKFDYQLNE